MTVFIWRWTSPLDGLDGEGYPSYGVGYPSYGVGAGGLYDGSGNGEGDATWYLDAEDHRACDPFKREGSYDFK